MSDPSGRSRQRIIELLESMILERLPGEQGGQLVRFIVCLVYVPRERYDTRTRRRMQAILAE